MDTFDKIDTKATGTKLSAAPTNLFVVRDDCIKIETKNSEQFHKVVAKTLFATNRSRPDTGTVMSYLTTHVRGPDEEDWSKLKHLMNYIRVTKEFPLVD